MAVPPLKFLLQSSYTPSGIVEELAPGLTACHKPWFTEYALEVTGVPGVAAAVIYLIPVNDEMNLLAANVDEAFEGLFIRMSGADFGDGMTKLVARHWPETYAMLAHSQKGTGGVRIIARMFIGGRGHWVVADQIPRTQDEMDAKQVDALMIAALETVIRGTNFYLDLPGVLEVLGGPDRTSRRLKAASTLFTSAGSIGSGLEDGIGADELVELAKDVREFITGLIALKD